MNSTIMLDQFKRNNFDLLRLFAAAQVVTGHLQQYLDLPDNFLFHMFGLFPGVPIFFFISGFLISKSYENTNFLEYARNRALRIYPALIVCTLLSLLAVFLTGYFRTVRFSIISVVAWIASHIIFVFYTPNFCEVTARAISMQACGRSRLKLSSMF